MTKSRRAALAARFDQHAEQESRILEKYRELSEDLKHSATGMLVNQILTEEEMHHLLLRTMATWLDSTNEEQVQPVPAEANRTELLRLTQNLREHERETIDGARQLISELTGEDEQFLVTLLDAMALDSEKHERLLAAVERMLTESS